MAKVTMYRGEGRLIAKMETDGVVKYAGSTDHGKKDPWANPNKFSPELYTWASYDEEPEYFNFYDKVVSDAELVWEADL
ncbi:MAG: hypothetical protein ACRC8W_01485 [Plesiomonas shigelloides]